MPEPTAPLEVDDAAVLTALRQATLIDLTQTLDETVAFATPLQPQFKHVVHNWYEPRPSDPQPLRARTLRQLNGQGQEVEGDFYACWMTIYEHSGTHFDAPVHCIPPPDSGLPHANEWGAVYGDMVPLRKFQGPLAVIDVTALRDGPQRDGISPPIEVAHVRAWEASNGSLAAGDVVALRTGWDEFFRPPPEGNRFVVDPLAGRSPGWPAPSVETIEYLHEKGVETVCSEVPSLGGSDDIWSAHYAGLGRGMVFIECLTNLDQLPARGAYFVFLAPKIVRSSGCFGRAMAWVPSGDGR